MVKKSGGRWPAAVFKCVKAVVKEERGTAMRFGALDFKRCLIRLRSKVGEGP